MKAERKAVMRNQCYRMTLAPRGLHSELKIELGIESAITLVDFTAPVAFRVEGFVLGSVLAQHLALSIRVDNGKQFILPMAASLMDETSLMGTDIRLATCPANKRVRFAFHRWAGGNVIGPFVVHFRFAHAPN